MGKGINKAIIALKQQAAAAATAEELGNNLF